MPRRVLSAETLRLSLLTGVDQGTESSWEDDSETDDGQTGDGHRGDGESGDNPPGAGKWKGSSSKNGEGWSEVSMKKTLGFKVGRVFATSKEMAKLQDDNVILRSDSVGHGLLCCTRVVLLLSVDHDDRLRSGIL